MKIVAIKTTPISVPLDPDRMIKSFRGSHARSPFLIVELQTDEGAVGLGEASCTPMWSGEDSAIVRHVIVTYLAPLLVGRDPQEVNRLATLIDGAIAGNYFAKAAVEMALWDLAAKALDVPLYQLWGGPVRSTVATKFGIAGVEPQRAAAIASWAWDQGFRAMKVKVGGDVEKDASRVEAVRSAVGGDVLLGVDANGGWDLAEARQAVRRLGDFDIAFLEQPLPPRQLLQMAELRSHLSIPLVADESVGTPEEAAEVVKSDAADVLDIYVGMSGGLGAARRIAALAHAAGLGWTVGSNRELGVGSAAQLHLAIATPGLDDGRVPCDINTPFYYQGDIIQEPLSIQAGAAQAPDRPGLGVALDQEAMERYREEL